MRAIPWGEEDGRDSEKSNSEISDLHGMFLGGDGECGGAAGG